MVHVLILNNARCVGILFLVSVELLHSWCIPNFLIHAGTNQASEELRASASGKFRHVPTSWHTAKSSVTLLGRPHDVNAFFFAVYPWIHTVNVFAVCPINGTRQTRPLPCLALPSGVRRRPPTAKTSPCAY